MSRRGAIGRSGLGATSSRSVPSWSPSARGSGEPATARRRPRSCRRPTRRRAARRRSFQSRFVAPRPGLHVHAACLVELGDGRVRAFWYSGSREGAADVEIHTAVFDPDRGEWGEEKAVATPAGTQRSTWRYVRKVGNPASIRTPDGTLWLFYVTVSVGGWGGSAINAVDSRDDGETWRPARRLVSSPFLNLSTMVRGEPVAYADGTIGLPVYQNLVGSFGQLLRLDATGAVIDRHRVSEASSCLQPIVLVRSPTEAVALLRNAGAERPNRVIWTDHPRRRADLGSARPPAPPQPGRRAVGARIARRPDPGGARTTSRSSATRSRSWSRTTAARPFGPPVGWRTRWPSRELPVDDARYDRTVEELARATDARVRDARPWVDSSRRFMCWEPRCHFEFSYPFLLQTRRGEIHLVYTWNRAFTKHVQFNQAWLDEEPLRCPASLTSPGSPGPRPRSRRCSCALPGIARLRSSHPGTLLLAAFVVALVPLGSLPAAGYLRGVAGDLSVTTVVLLLHGLLRPVVGGVGDRREEPARPAGPGRRGRRRALSVGPRPRPVRSVPARLREPVVPGRPARARAGREPLPAHRWSRGASRSRSWPGRSARTSPATSGTTSSTRWSRPGGFVPFSSGARRPCAGLEATGPGAAP